MDTPELKTVADPQVQASVPPQDLAAAVARLRETHERARTDPLLAAQLKAKEVADEHQAGESAGRLWAQETATAEDLRRIADVKRLHPERMLSLAHYTVKEVFPDAAGDRNFCAGFVEGAAKFWDEVKHHLPR